MARLGGGAAGEQDERFGDEQDGGWFSTTGDDPTVLLRLKEDYDGAEPAPSSIAALNLLTLSHLLGPDLGQTAVTPGSDPALTKVERTLARLGPRIGAGARAVPMMLCALSAWHAGFDQIVLVGDPDAPKTRALKSALAARYLPFGIVVPVAPGAPQQALAERLPFIGAMTTGAGAAAYVCRDFACRQPVSDPEDLAQELAAVHGVTRR